MSLKIRRWLSEESIIIYIVNIGVCQQITQNFAKNFAIYPFCVWGSQHIPSDADVAWHLEAEKQRAGLVLSGAL
jgi:hypothetical protein